MDTTVSTLLHDPGQLEIEERQRHLLGLSAQAPAEFISTQGLRREHGGDPLAFLGDVHGAA